MLEYKAAEPIELSDMSTEKRTAVIAHSVYDNIDTKGDIARKGMFSKSWKENKAIDFLIDHDKRQKPGTVTEVFEDEKKAYTKVKFGQHTLGNDTMLMMDEGIIKGASFGFYAIKANRIEVKGRKVRELKEVYHDETTVTYALKQINPAAGVVKVTKAELSNEIYDTKALSESEKGLLLTMVRNDQSTLEELIRIAGNLDIKSDLYTWVSWNISRRADLMGDIRSQLRYNASQMGELKAHLQNMESFCRKTSASDECINSVMNEIAEVKSIISQYDTEGTGLINQPTSSNSGNDSFRKQLLLLNAKLQLQ